MWKIIKVPRQEVWKSLRQNNIPKKYVKLIQGMYFNVRANVSSSVGETKDSDVKVGLHQKPALSPVLFNVVINV